MTTPHCLTSIDAIIYINLDHRIDRNHHVLEEIKKIDPTLSKTHRVAAHFVPEHGALGCSISHIKALELCRNHPEWKRCLILEDDFTFVSSPNDQIMELIISCESFDVLLLAYGHDGFVTQPTESPHIHRVYSSQTTSGYIVHTDYLSTLLKNYQESSDMLYIKGRCREGCLDQHWKQLMPEGKWYTYDTRIGYQYATFSDIENQFHNYEC